MRWFITLLLVFLLVPWSSGYCGDRGDPPINLKALEIAQKYTYLREKKNDNREPEITQWLKYCGLGPGYPYCQAFVNNCYKEAFEELGKKSPLSRSASVAAFAKWSLNNPLLVKSIPAKMVAMGYKVEPGAIISWKHGTALMKESFSYNGHAGMLKIQKGNNLFITIEGNTKPSNQGDQTGRTIGDTKYGNDGVYSRERSLGAGSKFPILYFIEVKF